MHRWVGHGWSPWVYTYFSESFHLIVNPSRVGHKQPHQWNFLVYSDIKKNNVDNVAWVQDHNKVPHPCLLFFLTWMQLLTAVVWILPLMEQWKLLEQLSETRPCTAAIQAIFSEDKITESARVVGSGQERSLFASVSSFCFDTCSHHNYLSIINDVYVSIPNMCYTVFFFLISFSHLLS